MSKKKLGISSFDLNIRFKDREEAKRYANRLIQFIRDTCKKNADKGWTAEAMVCSSNTKGNTTYVYYQHTGKAGRPKKVKEVCLPYENNCLELEWHLHILLVSKPLYAFRNEIKKYIDKNWGSLKIVKEDFDINKLLENKGVYKKNTNIKKAEYFIDQATDILFCNCNYTDEVVIPDGYSLKDLYNAYINSRTALIYHRSIKLEKRLGLEEKYKNIMNFYWDLTKEEDNKLSQKFIEESRLRKINENYEKIGKGNKVQKDLNISRRRIIADDGF